MTGIYKKDELENLQGNELQQKAQEIKQIFDQRRGYYHSLKNQVTDLESWESLTLQLLKFDREQFNVWNQKWNNIYRANNFQQLDQFFDEGERIFQEIDDLSKSVMAHSSHSPEIDSLKEEVLGKIEEDFITLKSEFIDRVDKGINNVLDLKAELGLEKNFSEKINAQMENSNDSKLNFMKAFVAITILMPFFWSAPIQSMQ